MRSTAGEVPVKKQHVLLVAGSPWLTGPEAEVWARRLINHYFDRLDRPVLIVAGSTDGPDAWAYLEALRRGFVVAYFRGDGFRLDTTSRGTNTTAWPGRSRDAAMVHALATARKRGCEVDALLIHPTPDLDRYNDLHEIAHWLKQLKLPGNEFDFDPSNPDEPRLG
jgi:hypothetical protein